MDSGTCGSSRSLHYIAIAHGSRILVAIHELVSHKVVVRGSTCSRGI